MKKYSQELKSVYPPYIYQAISMIGSRKKKNLIRGYLSRPNISASGIDEIRKDCGLEDIYRVGAILRSPRGLLDSGKYKEKKESKDIYQVNSSSSLSWKKEVSYLAGYIDATLGDAISILHYIRGFMCLDLSRPEESLNFLLVLAKKYGASNYLSYKLAYIKSAYKLSFKMMDIVSEIEDEISHKESPGFHFSALENLSPKIPIFIAAQKRVSPMAGRLERKFRRAITLSNFVPTPVSDDDCAEFLLRATESCLFDTVYSVLIIFNLSDSFKEVVDELSHRLSTEFLSQMNRVMIDIESIERRDIVTEFYKNQADGDSLARDLYRLSSSFLERKDFAKYRNSIDKVIGIRLVSDIFEGSVPKIFEPFYDKEVLLAKNGFIVDEAFGIPNDTFYKTYLFLRFIQDPSNLIKISNADIKCIFENTMELEVLLSEDELNTLHVMVPDESKGLVAVLALALYRKKSIDPDVDYQFRSDLVSYVKKNFGGSIVRFIEYLLDDSPQVAGYIVASLDEITLEKMYTLIRNSSEASEVRREILTVVGRKLNRIEYIIEAESISTRAAVSKLQKYFDSSRMYVDSVAMKKWLDGNPSISAEQFSSLFSDIGQEEDNRDYYKRLLARGEVLVNQMAKDAFEQFCLNTEFGIQSYLGRRIRHNTLDGVTTEPVDAVLFKPDYASAMSIASKRRSVEAWRNSYKSIIDKLRRESLQFKSGGSLFKSSLDFEDFGTKENVRKLMMSLVSSGSAELINDLIIAFCWRQITPQLENAARHIKINVIKEANASIEKYFSDGPTLEAELKAELHEAVNEVFRKVADWFQVPQTGFISASVRDLCQIILIDLNRPDFVDYSGNAIDRKYTGISVHRLYDCLVVFLQNAEKHREDKSRVTVTAKLIDEVEDSVLEKVEIEVCSSVAPENFYSSKERMLSAISATEVIPPRTSGAQK